jgi:hypothetical protein
VRDAACVYQVRQSGGRGCVLSLLFRTDHRTCSRAFKSKLCRDPPTLVERKKRQATIVSLCGTLVALGGVLLGTFLYILLNISIGYFWIAYFAFVVITTILYRRSFTFRCPRCDKDLIQFAMQGNSAGTDQNIRFCPFCGLDLDEKIDPESRGPTEVLERESGQGGFEIKNTNIQLSPDKQKASTNIQLPPGKEDK